MLFARVFFYPSENVAMSIEFICAILCTKIKPKRFVYFQPFRLSYCKYISLFLLLLLFIFYLCNYTHVYIYIVSSIKFICSHMMRSHIYCIFTFNKRINQMNAFYKFKCIPLFSAMFALIAYCMWFCTIHICAYTHRHTRTHYTIGRVHTYTMHLHINHNNYKVSVYML